MPICPQCSATIHAGAEDQCPACGYSLLRANVAFGDDMVEFTRVVDSAGALTHAERMELMKALEDLERKINPAALCVYITDDGQVNRLRSHAHWILNHARIHHPSFGKRELHKAIEDAELRERRPGDKPAPQKEEREGALARLWNGVVTYFRDAFYPYAPPVKQEWMLVLVVDVQLEMACFSWGYMLDPYINPDSINSCIVSARLQFRERAFVPGLKKVMRAAVHRIAADAHRTNRRLRRRGGAAARAVAAALLAWGLLAAPADAAPTKPAAATTQKSAAKKPAPSSSKPAAKPAAKTAPKVSKPAPKVVKPAPKPAQSTSKPATKPAPQKVSKPAPKPAAKPTPKPAPAKPQVKEQPKPAAPAAEDLPDDAVAEDPEEETPAVPAPAEEPAAPADTPAPADAPAPADTPATQPPPAAPAPDQSASYGSAPRWQQEHYRLLMAGELETGYASLFPNGPKAAAPDAEKTDESDTTVLGRYCEAYTKSSDEVLRDPQGLLSTMEREDVEHVLHTLNAQSNFHLYLAVFKGGQDIPGELSVDTLANSAVPTGEYAAMILYPLGNTAGIELGYQLIKPDEARRHEWLSKVRTEAAATGGGIEGVLAAIRCAHADILPLSADFKPVTAESAAKAPLIEIQYKPSDKEEKVSFKDRLKKLAENPENLPIVLVLVGMLAAVGLFCLYFFYLRRRTAGLLETPPDLRLSSPYGAGVSRYVRYLEGKEAGKEKRLF